MRRSITRVIVLVTTATVLALGFPLAYVLQRAYHGEAVVRLQRQAALAIGEVTLPLDAQTVASALSEPDYPLDVAVYDQTGHFAHRTGTDPTGPSHARSPANRPKRSSVRRSWSRSRSTIVRPNASSEQCA